MNVLCQNIEQMVTCFTCRDQATPPFRLCLDSHVTCATCPKYLHQCVCGHYFAQGPHTSFDSLIRAMRLKCKYNRTGQEPEKMVDGAGAGGDTGSACVPGKWYTTQELSDHYRGECTRNTFVCRVNGCGRVCHVETVAEHYEAAHGPFELLRSDDPMHPNTVSFYIPTHTTVVRRMFNGYFLLSAKTPISFYRNPTVRVTMHNINPMDRMRYTYTAEVVHEKGKMTCKVSVTLKEWYE